jgi:condensin complex subunit 3
VVRFLVGFTAARPEGREDEADDFAEAFLGFLLNLAGARDKAVRFRTCQIVAGVLNALGRTPRSPMTCTSAWRT